MSLAVVNTHDDNCDRTHVTGCNDNGQDTLRQLQTALHSLSPQVRKAARYTIDNPGEIGVLSMRQLADAADVQPNTMVRMARSIGFDNYEAFRKPFRSAAAQAAPSFTDRARWLQSINARGRHGELLTQLAAAALGNIEELYESLDADELKNAADAILAAKHISVLGVGTAKSLAENFCYVAAMIGSQATTIPAPGRIALDDIANLTKGDVLVAMTFSPYRSEIVEATQLAIAQDVTVIAISDSRTSPICITADHAFAVPTGTPQYYSSIVAAAALLETLLAFMAADTTIDAAQAIDAFHQRRRSAGIYTPDSP